jgi:hypothetical protein
MHGPWACRTTMKIETYLKTSAPAGDQRGPDDDVAVRDLLNCLSRAAVDVTAGYTENARPQVKLGDVLWYVAAIARRRKLSLAAIAKQDLPRNQPSSFDHYMKHTRADGHGKDADTAIRLLLNGLIRAATDPAVHQPSGNKELLKGLGLVFWHIAAVARRLKLRFSDIARDNLKRTQTMFGASKNARRFFDDDFDTDEQFPRRISLRFSQSVRNGLATVRMAIKTKEKIWLPIGSPLNDNSHIDDDYRFHDVLHLAYVAILGWSPVMRALFGLKRKSSGKHDRVEDGARAILLEEALTGIVYESASDDKFFKERDRLERRLLLTVKRLTRNLEVSVRTYDQWTEAILRGYAVFREITAAAKMRAAQNRAPKHIGLVNLDMTTRTITFKPC